jgi:hypothetical protein
MLRRGLSTLNDLDKVEEKERKEVEEKREREEREAAVEELLAGPSPPNDPDLGILAFNPYWTCSNSQLEELGFPGIGSSLPEGGGI